MDYSNDLLTKAAICPTCNERNLEYEYKNIDNIRVVCKTCGRKSSYQNNVLGSVKAWNAESYGLSL